MTLLATIRGESLDIGGLVEEKRDADSRQVFREKRTEL
jgi:hypothetical protein